jgi:hypothetical protein
MTEVSSDGVDDRVGALWGQAARLLSNTSNSVDVGRYSWATLRAVVLHGLAMQGLRDASENAAVQLLSLMAEISPPKRSSQSALMAKLEEDEEIGITDESFRSEARNDSASYIGTGESVVSAARSYVRETRAKVAEARKTSFFTGIPKDSALLTVAQSKWVEDDEIPTILLPMAEFSEISESIIAMRCVWSAIKFDSCFAAQKRVVREISDLRAKVPSSTISTDVAYSSAESLPIKIVSLKLVESEARSKLERVKVKPKGDDTGAMATFYNPFAVKKDQDQATIVPEEEERYILVRFANTLSIPLQISRCQLEFNKAESDRIKAPAISFVIPGRTNNFAVQFPFIIKGSEPDDEQEAPSNLFEVNGLHVACLARSFFLPLTSAGPVESKAGTARNIPEPASKYPLRDSNAKQSDSSNSIRSPKIEVVPAQPHLLLSFASAPTVIQEDAVIPVPLADGEIFCLPKLFLSVDSGISGVGRVEELKISASGVPGFADIVLFDLSGSSGKEEVSEAPMKKKVAAATPLVLTAHCENMDGQTLNDPRNMKTSSLNLTLTASPDMGSHIRGCTIKISFRYRGKIAAPSLEVWRRRDMEILILRTKGPRVSSLTFRPDLNWDSYYSDLCLALAQQDKHTRYRPGKAPDAILKEQQAGSNENADFSLGRIGTDSAVHVCGDKVVIFVAVANESTSMITLWSPNGPVGGFEGSTVETMKVNPGVSAKIPIILPRIDRAPGVDEKLCLKTRLHWKSELAANEACTETGGTIVPLNKRVRTGSIMIPLPCLKTIIDENPIFLSRVCKAPCTIHVGVSGVSGEAAAQVSISKPLFVTVDIDLATWIPDSVLSATRQTLEFCCTPKGSTDKETTGLSHRHFVWSGHVRKVLGGGTRKQTHKARLLFLEEGEYVVSACLSFKKMDLADDVKEIWWAERARVVQVVPTSYPAKQ